MIKNAYQRRQFVPKSLFDICSNDAVDTVGSHRELSCSRNQKGSEKSQDDLFHFDPPSKAIAILAHKKHCNWAAQTDDERRNPKWRLRICRRLTTL
jgi:hypothetical protein